MVGKHWKNKVIRMLIYHLTKKRSNMLRVFYRGVGYFTNSTEAIALRSFKTLFHKFFFNLTASSSASSFTNDLQLVYKLMLSLLR